jgi:hypothetical protein
MAMYPRSKFLAVGFTSLASAQKIETVTSVRLHGVTPKKIVLVLGEAL